MKIKKDDTIVVISGKDKSKRGKVRFVYPKKERILVEGVNFIKKHSRPVSGARQAGIIEREAPIHVSKVMLLCNRCNRPTRISYRFLEDGKKVRYCRKCTEVID